jgi:hypothetical protein
VACRYFNGGRLEQHKPDFSTRLRKWDPLFILLLDAYPQNQASCLLA